MTRNDEALNKWSDLNLNDQVYDRILFGILIEVNTRWNNAKLEIYLQI